MYKDIKSTRTPVKNITVLAPILYQTFYDKGQKLNVDSNNLGICQFFWKAVSYGFKIA